MYAPDYGNMAFLWEDRLREAERQRKQNELIRAVLAHKRAEKQGGLLEQIKRWMHPQQENTDARRAHAV